MNEIEKLAEEVKLLRERVAVLEYKLSLPITIGIPQTYPVKTGDGHCDPYIVTCKS